MGRRVRAPKYVPTSAPVNLYVREGLPQLPITRSDDVALVIREQLDSGPAYLRLQERAWAIGLDGRNRIRYVQTVSIGGQSSAPIDPKVIFRMALLEGVTGLIFVHNHPSNEVAASPDDVGIFRRLAIAAQTLGFRLLDCIIVPSDGTGHYSAAEHGTLMG